MKIKVLAFIFSILVYWGCTTKSIGEIKLRCSYMAYACGDCYTQFKVDSVLSVNDESKGLLGQDISIYIEENGAIVPLEQKVDKCWICYDYYVSGYLEKQWFISYNKFIAKNYDLVLRSPDCCPKEP
jgi:hypothetical protein